MNKEIPLYVYKEHGNARNWIRHKRKEIKTLRKAMNDVRIGCAFFPQEAYSNLVDADKKLETAYQSLKKWWKKI